MPIPNVQENRSKFPPVEVGLHNAVCVSIYHCGHITNQEFNKTQDKIVLMFELPELPRLEWEKDGKKESMPRALAREFTYSMHEKGNLRPIIEGWRGKKMTEEEAKKFNIMAVLGKPCMVQVMHDGEGEDARASVKVVLPPPKGAVIQAATKPLAWSVTDLEKPELPAGMAKWIANKVTQSQEWAELTKRISNQQAEQPTERIADAPASDDDIPF
jgi:hypothetical protein